MARHWTCSFWLAAIILALLDSINLAHPDDAAVCSGVQYVHPQYLTHRHGKPRRTKHPHTRTLVSDPGLVAPISTTCMPRKTIFWEPKLNLPPDFNCAPPGPIIQGDTPIFIPALWTTQSIFEVVVLPFATTFITTAVIASSRTRAVTTLTITTASTTPSPEPSIATFWPTGLPLVVLLVALLG